VWLFARKDCDVMEKVIESRSGFLLQREGGGEVDLCTGCAQLRCSSK